MSYRKKLIEVALPLDAINNAAAREKSIRHGHPSTLHLWWARRPLATARAVIFAQMVDDPSACPDEFPTEADQEMERQRLFGLIEELVKCENTNNEEVLNRARVEIRRSWARTCKETGEYPEKLPAFHDPFAGGGALPLEAQRLGLEAYASDLNPVAVMINKAMIEIPPKFANRPPVNPESGKDDIGTKTWSDVQGIAEDVRYYGRWMRDEAEKRIGHLYPKIHVSDEMIRERPDLEPHAGKHLTVIAWIWARTVKSPNPAFSQVDVPLIRSFRLSTKKGKEAWVEPLIRNHDYQFRVKLGNFDYEREGTVNRKGGVCLMSGTPMPFTYIRSEGQARRLKRRLMAIVAEGANGRVYLSPTTEAVHIAKSAIPDFFPELSLPANPRDFKTPNYGMHTFGDLYTSRQLVSLTTFSGLVQDARDKAILDACSNDLTDDGVLLNDGGTGPTAYGDAIAVYLALAVSKLSDSQNALVTWKPSMNQAIHLFTRQAIPMCWDFAESNVFSNGAGAFLVTLKNMMRILDTHITSGMDGRSSLNDASIQRISEGKIISTDPPYYDNIGYADLSDFFYVWLRKALRSFFPDVFSTMVVPKAAELVACPYRHHGRAEAEKFFLEGMTNVLEGIGLQASQHFPVSIYYAFKQSESEDDGVSSTGWSTFLQAVVNAGLSIVGTWPMRTEMSNRMIGSGKNALASSIVLVCRRRTDNAGITTRRDFHNLLRTELPDALRHLQHANIAPVDLAQSAIGPGMAVFSRFNKIVEAEGTPMIVGTALAIINEVLDEILAEQEGELDPDSRWVVSWYEQHGFGEGPFGTAETLCKARNTSVAGLVAAGILYSRAGKVNLLRREELESDWDPQTDKRLTVWEATQHLIRTQKDQGEEAAAELMAKLGGMAEYAKDLAYRLYVICERKGWAQDAVDYNALVIAWPELTRLAASSNAKSPTQGELL